MKATHRYTFDAKLFAVIQITAVDERQARRRLDRINGLPLDHHHGDEITITSVSVDGEADLIEADDADTPAKRPKAAVGHENWRPRGHRALAAPVTAAARELRAMVAEHLRRHPGLDFSPAELANVLGRPSSRGAIINACKRLVELGQAIRTRQAPQRYQAHP